LLWTIWESLALNRPVERDSINRIEWSGSMSIYAQHPLNQDDDSQSPFGPLFTAMIVAAAGVLYVLTRHPLLAAILPWLHGGWATLSTGLWILRKDPSRRRAWTCFAFYTAVASWKAAAVALATLFIFFVVSQLCGVPVNDNEFIATLLAFAAGLLLSSLICIAAVVAALRCKVRVYYHAHLRSTVHGELTNAARIRLRKHRFSLGRLVIGSLIVLPLLALPFVLMCMMMENKAMHRAFIALGRNLGAAAVLLVTVALPWSGIYLAQWLCLRVVADSPGQCWPPGTC
jgi:hypothetical protein